MPIFFTVGTQPIYDESIATGDPVFCQEGKWAFRTEKEARQALRSDPRLRDLVWPAVYLVDSHEGTQIKHNVLKRGCGSIVMRVWPRNRKELVP